MGWQMSCNRCMEGVHCRSREAWEASWCMWHAAVVRRLFYAPRGKPSRHPTLCWEMRAAALETYAVWTRSRALPSSLVVRLCGGLQPEGMERVALAVYASVLGNQHRYFERMVGSLCQSRMFEALAFSQQRLIPGVAVATSLRLSRKSVTHR